MVDLNLKVPAVKKLLEFVESSIGAVGGSMLARWQARAAADAARITAQGQADAMRITAEGQADSTRLIAGAQAEAQTYFPIEGQLIQGEVNLGKEIESRLTFQEQKRQNNIEAVVKLAADELGDKEVQNHDVDHDWIARFFSDAQDVTSEHMQRIWAKILAGEVETPGRTSLHTLSILKNMSQRDAELFKETSRFIFDNFIFNHSKYICELPDFPTYKLLMDMRSYGLLSLDFGITKSFNIPLEGIKFYAGRQIYKISRNNEKPYELEIPILPLSPQGYELYSLIEPVIDEKYLRLISKFLNDKHASKLEYAKVLQNLEDHVPIGAWTIVEPL